MNEVTKPLVSIIIATMNASTHIGKCLESIAAQSLASMEVVIVDVSIKGELGILQGAR